MAPVAMLKHSDHLRFVLHNIEAKICRYNTSHEREIVEIVTKISNIYLFDRWFTVEVTIIIVVHR